MVGDGFEQSFAKPGGDLNIDPAQSARPYAMPEPPKVPLVKMFKPIPKTGRRRSDGSIQMPGESLMDHLRNR